MPPSLAAAAVAVLSAADPDDKVRLSLGFAEAWRSGAIGDVGACPPPDRPARPGRPELLPPNRMPRRKYGGAAGRIALMHALAHIELNAIDLAWDIVARFTFEKMPREFYEDWVRVAADEARHFAGVAAAMAELGAAYGDLPAHDGLWQAAEKTATDLKARLALVPMTLEARGLDTTPATVDKLRRHGDPSGAAVLAAIAADEESHVAAGVRWFEWLCRRDGDEPVALYHRIIRASFGPLKPPFNVEGRGRAGMAAAYYQPLAGPPA